MPASTSRCLYVYYLSVPTLPPAMCMVILLASVLFFLPEFCNNKPYSLRSNLLFHVRVNSQAIFHIDLSDRFCRFGFFMASDGIR